MKKRYLVLPIMLGLLLCIVFLGRVRTITAVDLKIISNNSIDKVLNNTKIEDQKLIDEINSIVTNRIYFKQPLYTTYSRDYVDYEIFIIDGNVKNGNLNYSYRIILNPDHDGNIGNRSRIDIEKLGGQKLGQLTDYSLFLTEEQENALVKLVQQYEN